MKNFLLLFLLFFSASAGYAQSFKVYGKITDLKMDPLAFASVQVQELPNIGTSTREDGSYELTLEVGRYNLVVTMIGYKKQIINIVVTKSFEQNLVLEEDNTMEDVVIRVKVKDRAEEIMRNVIRNKDSITSASGAYSAKLYIKAIQQDSVAHKRDRSKTDSSFFQNPDMDIEGMAMTEVSLKLDYESDQRLKEQRLGVKKHGEAQGLFYLSATEGNFSFYCLFSPRHRIAVS